MTSQSHSHSLCLFIKVTWASTDSGLSPELVPQAVWELIPCQCPWILRDEYMLQILQERISYFIMWYMGFHLHSWPGPQVLGAGMPGTPSGSPSLSTQALSAICVSASLARKGLIKGQDEEEKRIDMRLWGCGEEVRGQRRPRRAEGRRQSTVFRAA